MPKKLRLDQLLKKKKLVNSLVEATNLINNRKIRISNYNSKFLFKHTLVNEDCDRHSTVGFYIACHIPQHVIMHNFHKASLIGIMFYLLNNFRVSMSYDNGASGYGGAANGKFYFYFSKALDCQNDMS